MTIAELVKKGNCRFSFLRAGRIYYDIDIKDYTDPRNVELHTWRFSIPFEDVGSATFNASEKPITLMRWIRIAKEAGELTLIAVK